jgi:hypothetical protein
MIKIEQKDWVEEVLNDGMVGRLCIQFNKLVAKEESYQSCL